MFRLQLAQGTGESSGREVKILMRLPDGRNVATLQAVHRSAPCARTEVLALFAVGDVYVSLCKKALTLHLARGEGRERYFGGASAIKCCYAVFEC